jgi:hypothetical protein
MNAKRILLGMLAVLGVGWFAGHASAASYIYSNGVWIRIGSISCEATGIGSVNLNTDSFSCKVEPIYANVLCVNNALNNGNPETASVQLNSAGSNGDLLSFDRNKQRYWYGVTTVEVDTQITNDLCVNPNWQVVQYYAEDDEGNSTLKPVWAIAGMDVTLSVESCKSTSKGTTCTTRTATQLTCGPRNEDGTYVYDANFYEVDIIEGTATAYWSNPPKKGDFFGCQCKDPDDTVCADLLKLNEGEPEDLLP